MVAALLILVLVIAWSVLIFLRTRPRHAKSVCVVVLGDLGHSPRMTYHALSLADAGFSVTMVGYINSSLASRVTASPNITVSAVRDVPKWVTNLPKLGAYLVKAAWQGLSLLFCLPHLSSPSHVLLQNPPGVPALPACWLYCLLHRCKLVVDFHNYSFTILAMSCGNDSPLVRLTKAVERFFAARCHSALCVTKAMQVDLSSNWGIPATVLYDRPPDIFHPISHAEKHVLLKKLSQDYPIFLGDDTKEDSTALTEVKDGETRLRKDRPGLLVSSTSWTEDEDFSVLMDALNTYQDSVRQCSLPDLVCVITGKGPMKEMYCRKVEEAGWNNITVITPWLEQEDYPKILASADLGVCLHTSSSGLDLPMKVVDMFGCGLPVAAVHYNCVDELVKDGINGVVFRDSDGLADALVCWFKNFTSEIDSRHKIFRENLHGFRNNSWKLNWTANALPIFS